MGIHGSTLLYMAIDGNTLQYMVIHSNRWECIAVHGLYMALHGSMRKFNLVFLVHSFNNFIIIYIILKTFI